MDRERCRLNRFFRFCGLDWRKGSIFRRGWVERGSVFLGLLVGRGSFCGWLVGKWSVYWRGDKTGRSRFFYWGGRPRIVKVVLSSDFLWFCFNRQADDSHKEKTTHRGTCRHTGTSWFIIFFKRTFPIPWSLLPQKMRGENRNFSLRH